MRLQYLGTAAAESWPGLFCNCLACKKAKTIGGRNIRTRSQALVNQDLLIDFPCDTNMHFLNAGLNLSAIKTILVTHAHNDHFAPIDLAYRDTRYYCKDPVSNTIKLAGDRTVMERLNQLGAIYGNDGEILPSEVKRELLPLYTPTVYDEYTVTALRACHYHNHTAQMYLIEGEKNILYLHDTALPYDEVFEHLIERGIKIDLISYDCTFGTERDGGNTHMGLADCIKTKERFEKSSISKAKTIHILNHFSHNSRLIYDELVPIAAEHGFDVSYDGMIVEF